MVPEGWKLSTIDEIATVTSGGTPSRKKSSFWGGRIPWVTTAEIKLGTILDTAEKITEEGLKNSSAKLFPVNTILMAMYGQGKTRGQVAKLGIEATTNQACAAINLNTGYDVDYYYQFLKSRYDQIREMSNSGSQENLSAGIVKSMQIPVPPLPEQQKIAQILSTWDKAIDKLEALIRAKQQRKKALMQQLLTGKVRFGGFPSKWNTIKLSKICSIRRGASPRPINDPIWFNDKGRGWIRISDLTGESSSFLTKTSQYLSEQGVKKSVPVEPGDLIMSICATIGVPKILAIQACIHDGFVVFRNYKEHIDTTFLFHYLGFITDKCSGLIELDTSR